MLIKFGLGVFC